MDTISNSYSTLAEKELFEILTHVISGSSVDHKNKRIQGLEELQRRITSNSIQDKDEVVRILLDMAKKQGNNQPESSLITDSLKLFIKKHEEYFQTVLDRLKGKDPTLFIVYSKLVLSLDYDKKGKSLNPLVDFLISRDALNSIGVEEVYSCLVRLGNEKLSKEIVKEASPYLNINKICAIVFSVRLCSKYANHKLLPKMLEVLDKSMRGYFHGHSFEIERDICEFLERVHEVNSLFKLLELLKIRYDRDSSHIQRAIGRILDAHPYRVENVLDFLYDQRDEKLVDAILDALNEIKEAKVDARKLLSSIRINWWDRHPIYITVHQLLVKGGDSSKPVLFEILKEKEKHDFALRCLKEIGVSNEELSNLFPKPVMLQVYDFLCAQAQSRKIPKDLNQLWEDKSRLGGNVPGKTNWLEHLLLHIFTSFNFVTLNIAPLKIECVDLVCFYHETVDLFIIGCTTGILKDDLAKMDALINKLEKEMPNLFDKCSITPIVVSSEIAAISPSDAKYSAKQGIVIIQSHHIDKLLEMLNTNRKPLEVIKYIENCKWSQMADD